MKIDVITLFPNMYDNFLNESIIRRAIEKNIIDINIVDLRNYSYDKNKRVDDYPYGGGSGMVLMCEPVFNAIESLRKEESKVVMMTPDGVTYNQKEAYNLSKLKHLIILCGHYEGFDDRIRSIVDLEISIGDYILTGGEIASMVIMDSVIRLVDGVIKEESHQIESFNNHLLDYPNYTKPRIFRDMEVPEVLISGHHENIAKWRLEMQIKKTKEKRPDLLKDSDLNE